MPPVPSNSVFQASPVVVEGLSLDKSIGREKTESTAETVSETTSGNSPGTVLETAPKTISGRDANGRGIGSYTSTKYANNRYPERTDSESDCRPCPT